MMELIEKIIHMVAECSRNSFSGKISLWMKNGKITQLEKCESIEPDKL